MFENKTRVGKFTSSGIYVLAASGKTNGFSAGAITLIKEVAMERRINRPLDAEAWSKPTSWGNFMEEHAFAQMDFEYQRVSQQTIVHPLIDVWGGSPDVTAPNKVGDIKCPFTMKSFLGLVDPLYMKGVSSDPEEVNNAAMVYIRQNHSDGEKYYWQLVSNSILTGASIAELIVFCPKKSSLDALRLYALDTQDSTWISNAPLSQLPWLPDESGFNELNVIRFEVPQHDKDWLTEKVVRAEAMVQDILKDYE